MSESYSLWWQLVPWLWLPFPIYTRILRTHTEDIMKQDVSEPAEWPLLSIVIAACNEAETIEPALQSLLACGYPNLEIVVVDDRSTDGTGEKVAQLQDERICLLRVDTLPDGWLGKVHALKKGTEQAKGDWLLFTDADVHFSKEVLRKAIATCMHQGIDHLTLLPLLHSSSFLAQCCISIALSFIAISQKPWHASNPDRKEAVGAGAFNLVRRENFAKTDGFEWLKMDVADDIALGHMMKASGGKSTFYTAADDVVVEWYPSLSSAVRGLEKNAFAQMARFSLLRGVALSGVLFVMALVPFVCVHPALFPHGLFIVLLCAVVSGFQLYPISKIPRHTVVLSFVFGQLILAYIILYSTIRGVLRGGLIWRGTVYKTEDLRAGMRIFF